MYTNLNRPIVDDMVRVKYSNAETVNHREELQHDIAKEALRMMDIENAVEIISIADVASGTGLGSSSCYAVGLLKALQSMNVNTIGIAFPAYLKSTLILMTY